MQVPRGLDTVRVDFDDERFVADAGLIVPAAVAEHLGLKDLFEEHVDLGDAPGRAKVGGKAMTVIHAVLAGADSVDDCEVLRAASTSAVLGHTVAASSTLATFVGSFSWPHAHQIDKVVGVALRRAWVEGQGEVKVADPRRWPGLIRGYRRADTPGCYKLWGESRVLRAP
jgi:hypothetical protein